MSVGAAPSQPRRIRGEGAGASGIHRGPLPTPGSFQNLVTEATSGKAGDRSPSHRAERALQKRPD